MADNTLQTAADNIATDELSTLNGVSQSAPLPKAQRMKPGFGLDGDFTDVSNTNPLPVNLAASGGVGSPVTQALTAVGAAGLAGTTSTTGSAVINVASAGNVSFHLLATAFVGTVVFEQSLDPTGAAGTWAPVPCIPEDATTTPVATLAINTAVAYIRQYTQGMFGPALFRIRVSAFTSGTLNVYAKTGPGWFEGQPALAPSVSNIGTVSPVPASLAVTATATAGTGVTLTLPAVTGQFHYITALTLQRYATAALTGAAAPVVVTSTNLPGSLAWTFDTAGAIGTSMIQKENYGGNPLRSSSAGVATTVVAANLTNAIWRFTATYFTSA